MNCHFWVLCFTEQREKVKWKQLCNQWNSNPSQELRLRAQHWGLCFSFFCMFATVNKWGKESIKPRLYSTSDLFVCSGAPPMQRLLCNYETNKNTNTKCVRAPPLCSPDAVQHCCHCPFLTTSLTLHHSNLCQFQYSTAEEQDVTQSNYRWENLGSSAACTPEKQRLYTADGTTVCQV